MSKTINMKRTAYRGNLLATVSVVALIGSGITTAAAADTDRPLIWLDLGWHFERDGGGQEAFNPAFVSSFIADGFTPPAKIENALPWSYGADGEILYQPENSDWIISASIRYGRTHGAKSVHQQTTAAVGTYTAHLGALSGQEINQYARYEEVKTTNIETHTILDFQAGKDLGLGLFGMDSTTVVGVGVRYAQIKSGSHDVLNGDPDFTVWTNWKYPNHNDTYHANSTETRNFRGIGPTLSLSSFVPLAGNPSDGELALDWGMNGGILFGKQRATGHHQTTTDYFTKRVASPPKYYSYHQQPVVPHNRSCSVTVPNLGGFAGVSLKWTNAKISLGYRADVFFGAIDGGIDRRKSENRGFYGPFASISIGLGD